MRKFTKLTSVLMILLFASSTAFSQYANSVYNQLMDEYLQNGDKAMVVNLAEQSKGESYKKVTIDLKGKGMAYGYVAYDPSSTLPEGPAFFDTDTPGTMASLSPTTSGDFIAAGTWADGIWYGEEYGTGNLYTIDEGDGTMTLVGSGGIGFNGMAYDGSTMYACTSTDLYSVDLSTGASTMIGSMGNGGGVMIALACDGSTLYGFDLGDDNLYDIDVSSGAATLIGSLGIDMNYAQDAEFDKDNNVLYLSGYTTSGELYTVDPSTAAATLVGGFAGGAEICGFAIPYTGITFPNDVGIMSITSPASGGDLTNAESVTVKIKNYGDNPQSNFDVYYTLDGGAQNVETISSTIEPGDILIHTFASTVDLSAYGFYEFTACTMLSGDDNTDNDCKDKTVENFPPSYCDATTSIEDETIGHVVCGDIDNTSGWQGGVADYTDQSTAIDAGGSVDITVTNTGGIYTSDITYVWVDWNDDYEFEQGGDEEFPLENVGGTGQTFTGTITAPADAMGGMHRMRVRMTWSTAPVPCGDASYGEIEDYSIEVGGGGNAIFADDFDAYNAGEQVACQNPDDWTTWSNAPCGSEDAYVSDAFAYSGANSANVVTNNDLVYELPEYFTTGAYKVGMMVYIPTGFDGYYNVLSDFGGGASPEWGFEVYFNVGGDGSVNAGATGAATFTFPFDTWMYSEVVIDLDNDMAQYYLDGNMIVEWAWTAGAAGGGAQLQLAALDFFGATATTSLYFDDFMIEDITAPPVLDPPTDLNGSVDGNDVTLTWTAPGGGSGSGDPQWIQWDSGENTGNGIGLTNGGTFMVASRWMPDELTDFDGMSVTQLSFYANGDPAATYVMKIWTGDAAGTEVMSQDVATFTVDDFNIIDLDNPVTIDASMQYWFGYEVTHGAGTFPAGADDGPAVQESGDMISLDGVEWVGMSAAYGLDYNWNIAIYVDNLKNAAPAQAIVKSTIPAATGTLANSGALSGKLNVFAPAATKDLTGYNVYRDSEMIGSTTETTYIDMDLPDGTYNYCVTATYDEGESSEICTVVTVSTTTSSTFFDDFESGDSNWEFTGSWGLTEEYSYSTSHSLADSPGGNYLPNQETYATMANGVDLTDPSILSSAVSWWMIYDIEGGNFDHLYIEASDDDFANFIQLADISGEGNLDPWLEYSYSLGSFVGSDNVKVRFHFSSDQGYEVDGCYIDDFAITNSDVDSAPPEIFFDAPFAYEAGLGDYLVEAVITDVTGVASAEVLYTKEGVPQANIVGVNTSGDNWEFTIPASSGDAGSQFDFQIEAIDSSPAANETLTDTASYISGVYIGYDNAEVNFYTEIGPGGTGGVLGTAVKFEIDQAHSMKTALIRNYADQSVGLNDEMVVHVWDDGGDGPGNDLIDPITMLTEATLVNTNAFTRVDLRPFEDELGSIAAGTVVYVGFTVPDGVVRTTITQPGIGLHSYLSNDGIVWGPITDDYHYRIILGDYITGIEDVDANSSTKVYPNPASDVVNVKSEMEITHVKVYNNTGQLVSDEQVNSKLYQLNTSQFEAGLYFFQIESNDAVISKRIVIQ